MTQNLTREDVDAIRPVADRGDRNVQYMLGLALRSFPGLGRPGEAMHYLTLAAEAGDGRACEAIAQMWAEGSEGNGIVSDPVKAIAWLERGAALGNAKALHRLGLHLLDGIGVARDPARAVAALRQAAELGEAGAQSLLAGCLLRGMGCAADPTEARTWAQRAADSGDQFGAMLLASLPAETAPSPSVSIALSPEESRDFLHGIYAAHAAGVQAEVEAQKAAVEEESARRSENPPWRSEEPPGQTSPPPAPLTSPRAEAGDARNERMMQGIVQRTELRKRAESGDVEAQYELGMSYVRDGGSDNEIMIGGHYLDMAARNGHADAQFALFLLHQRGLGVSKDEDTNLRWLIKAAQQGHGKALYYVARRYADGRIDDFAFPGTKMLFLRCQELYPDFQDPEEPPRTFDDIYALAATGSAMGLYLLAQAYFRGEGTPVSEEYGLSCLQQAVASGYAAAQFELARRLGVGEGVPLDHAKGKELAVLAARQGFAEAEMMLETLFQVDPEEMKRLLAT